MRVTDKDRKIYNYIEEVGFATVKQIANIFFNDITFRNELAKKRLNCLIEHGYINQCKSHNCTQHVFYVENKFKKQSYHNIVVLDFLSELKKMDYIDVISFSRVKAWGGKKVISDLYVNISLNGKSIHLIVEVQASNNMWLNSINKYADEEVLSDMLDVCEGELPYLIFVDDIKHDLNKVNSLFKIIQIDLKMNNFPYMFNKL